MKGGAPWGRLALVALLVFATRAPFPARGVEDYDSVNFALALERFDPVAHRPHPPGFPIFVALGQAVGLSVEDPVKALSLLSALAQAALVFPAFLVLSALAPTRREAWLALLLLLSCPLLWFNGARPLSDSVGLLFSLGAQGLLLRALATGRGLVLASALVGLSAGVRLQTTLLTFPLLALALWRGGPRLAAAGAWLAGTIVWVVPLLAATGGLRRYGDALGQTLGMSLDVEPLFTRFTPNLAARAARLLLLGPWVEPALGLAVLSLALAGACRLALRQPRRLALGALAFGPYFAFHAALQHVETVRYSLPYVPLLAWLAAVGAGVVASPLASPAARARAPVLLAAALALSSAVLTLPALLLYTRTPSPPAEALGALRGAARPASGYAVASHYTLQRYLRVLPAGSTTLAGSVQGALGPLADYWREGGRADVLFLAGDQHTDLEAIDARAQRSLGHWEWPARLAPFLAGTRPWRTELLRIARPDWFAAQGWLLSLELGRLPEAPFVEQTHRADLLALPEPTFLLVAGEPTGDAAGGSVDLSLGGLALASFPADVPLLRGLPLGPQEGDRYLALLARTRLGERHAGLPYVLRGLDYGRRSDAGAAHGDGWHYPERDAAGLSFRWSSGRARSLLHVPPSGASLVVQGRVPRGFAEDGAELRLLVDGVTADRARPSGAGFRLEARLQPAETPFREVVLETDRTFVPDLLLHNRDCRSLGVQVYSFQLTALPGRP